MGMTEVRTWMVDCDRCRRSMGTVTAEHAPSPPKGWEYEAQHDCGLTGYTRKILLCESCVRKAKGIKEDY